ncbi:MAG: ABC transporter permease subunit [Dysosmobacter sp.]
MWEVPKGAGKIGIINQGTEAGWLPVVGGQKYLLVILVVAVLTVFMYIYLNYSKHGYEIAVVGESQRTASYAGIKVERVIVRTMVLSGAVCGLMGLLLTAGYGPHPHYHHRGRPWLHRRHGIVDGEIQPHHHDLHQPAAGGAGPGRQRDLQYLRPESVLLGHSHRHHPVFHHRQRVFHHLSGQPA